MKTNAVRVVLMLLAGACGPQAVVERCSTPGDGAQCCDSEIAQQVCLGHQEWVCEPAWCSVGDPNCPANFPRVPTWFRNGGC